MDWLRDYKARTFAPLRLALGARVLDVGCGGGDDARALATQVGASGRVVAVDRDRGAVTRVRHTCEGLTVSTTVGDAAALPFGDATFDACRTDCTLQHVTSPAAVLAEMARVTRAGGRVVASEPDWEAFVVDVAERQVTRAILGLWTDRIVRNGWIGRALPRLVQDAGLDLRDVIPVTVHLADLTTACAVCPLRAIADTAAAQGVVTREAAQRWLDDLRAADGRGRFFAAVTGVIAVGRVR